MTTYTKINGKLYPAISGVNQLVGNPNPPSGCRGTGGGQYYCPPCNASGKTEGWYLTGNQYGNPNTPYGVTYGYQECVDDFNNGRLIYKPSSGLTADKVCGQLCAKCK